MSLVAAACVAYPWCSQLSEEEDHSIDTHTVTQNSLVVGLLPVVVGLLVGVHSLVAGR